MLALLSGLPAAGAETTTATVLSIGDGDSIRVRQQSGQTINVRLACIDAPEMAQSPWGPQARRALQQRLPIGSTVLLASTSTDRYGRAVAEVISDDIINVELVADGQAFVYRQFLSGCDARTYLDAEWRARRRRLGIWRMEGGITRPWEFRRRARQSLQEGDASGPRQAAVRHGSPG